MLAVEVDLVGDMEGMVVQEEHSDGESEEVAQQDAEEVVDGSGMEAEVMAGTRGCARGRRDSGTGLWRSDGGIRKCGGRRRTWTRSLAEQ